MGRDPCRPPPPDSRGDPSALLYEAQEVAAAGVVRRSLTTSHRTAQHLGLRNTEFAISSEESFDDVVCSCDRERRVLESF